MKRILLPLSILIFASACKEHSSLGVILDNSTATLGDTTYMAASEAVSLKKVVVEEFTGGSCTNCPAAREALAAIAASNPNRLVLLELHPKEIQQGNPYPGAKYDFTNSYVSQILSQYYPGIGQIPIAGIDRLVNTKDNTLFYNKSEWAGTINNQLAKKSPANIKLTNVSFDDATKEGIIKIKVAYTSDVTAKQFLTLAIIENDVVDIQECADSINHNYTFEHIYRKTVTPTTGLVMLDSIPTKKAGRVFETNIKYTIDASWNPAHCQLVVYLHNNESGNKEILQAEEISVK